jgi:type IV secretion system protein VirD4
MISRCLATLCRVSFLLTSVLTAIGLAVIAVRFPILVVVIALFIAWQRLNGWRASGWSHGSATVASLEQIEAAGMMKDEGLILGYCAPSVRPKLRSAVLGLASPHTPSEMAVRRLLAASFGKEWYADQILKVADFCHGAVFAPAGSGKGTDVLIPWLLSNAVSSVVVDPKGELYAKTAEHRRRKFGHEIIRIDPYSLKGCLGDTLNPFDFIDETAEDFLDQCRDLANMIIARTGMEENPHWNDSAELNLTAFIAFVCAAEKDRSKRNLQTVRGLAGSRQAYAKALEVMQRVSVCNGVVKRLGGLCTWFEGEELASVLTTFQRQTQFLDSPPVICNTSSSSFDPMMLRKGKATVYLILPAERLVSMAPLQRQWIGTIMNVITRGVPTEKNPVHWYLDEFAHIGRMQAIEDAVTLKRGMGQRLFFFFQSIEQLKTTFGDKAGTVLDNLGTQMYFGINSLETAQQLSKRIGEMTISVKSGGTSTSDSRSTGGGGAHGQTGNVSTSASTNMSDTARSLLRPEEILTQPRDLALIFHQNLPVIVSKRLRYFRAPEFRFGGTGRQRSVGLAALFLAALLLPASLLFVVAAVSIPQATPIRRSVYAVPGQRPAVSPVRRRTAPAQRYLAPFVPSVRRSRY